MSELGQVLFLWLVLSRSGTMWMPWATICWTSEIKINYHMSVCDNDSDVGHLIHLILQSGASRQKPLQLLSCSNFNIAFKTCICQHRLKTCWWSFWTNKAGNSWKVTNKIWTKPEIETSANYHMCYILLCLKCSAAHVSACTNPDSTGHLHLQSDIYYIQWEKKHIREYHVV